MIIVFVKYPGHNSFLRSWSDSSTKPSLALTHTTRLTSWGFLEYWNLFWTDHVSMPWSLDGTLRNAAVGRRGLMMMPNQSVAINLARCIKGLTLAFKTMILYWGTTWLSQARGGSPLLFLPSALLFSSRPYFESHAVWRAVFIIIQSHV
jgi:hypothetical protein